MLRSTGEKDSSKIAESTNLVADVDHDVFLKASGNPGVNVNESDDRDSQDSESAEVEQTRYDMESLSQTTIVVCLVILALLGVGYTMYFGKAIFMPIVFALLLNFIFSPTVIALSRRGVPAAIGALIVMGAGMALLLGLFWMLFAPAKSWLEKAPQNISKIEGKVSEIVKPLQTLRETTEKVDQLVDGSATLASGKPDGPSEKVESTTDDENAANDGDVVPLIIVEPQETPDDYATVESEPQSKEDKPAEAPVKVQLERPSLTGFVLSATGDALLGIALAFVLLYYLLAAGERGLEKMVELMPTFKDKKRIVGLTRDIQLSIVHYLRATTLINIGLGVVIGVGLWLIGMPNPLLWGVMACLLNFFPMIGACIGSLIVFVVALVTFDSISFALAAPTIYGGVNLIEANFVTPNLLGRSVSLHPVWLMVFFTIVTWLWGVGGAILAVPMLAIIKISCDHSDVFQPVGKFLGR